MSNGRGPLNVSSLDTSDDEPANRLTLSWMEVSTSVILVSVYGVEGVEFPSRSQDDSFVRLSSFRRGVESKGFYEKGGS